VKLGRCSTVQSKKLRDLIDSQRQHRDRFDYRSTPRKLKVNAYSVRLHQVVSHLIHECDQVQRMRLIDRAAFAKADRRWSRERLEARNF